MTDHTWEADPAVGSLKALRLTDGIALSAQEGKVLVENSATGAACLFAREALPVLERLTEWTSLDELLQTVHEAPPEATTPSDNIDRLVVILHALVKIEALITRGEDLTGARVPSPGEGWTDAMRFLLSTRTSKATRFAAPVEFNSALAEKSLLARQASAFMEYPEAPSRPLSPPQTTLEAGASFPEVLLSRRTARRYADEPITEPQLSTLLHFGWGMTRQVPNPLGDVFVRKTSPSGGSLHPVEVYPIALNVDGVPRGLYHYSVRRHALEQLWVGDAREWIGHACGDQEWVAEAAVVVLCTAFLPRTAWKYDFSRVARAVMAEIGFSGQSALLAATWLGLGSFTTLALRDEIFEELIGLDPTREPVFSVIGMGKLESSIADHSRPRSESAREVEGG